MAETDRSRAGYPRPQNFHEDLQYEHCNYYSPCSQCGHNFMGLPHRIACKLCETVWALTDERDALLVERDRMRAAGDALYESMDCRACRISSDFTFCAQCVADREQWRNLAPARTPHEAPTDG